MQLLVHVGFHKTATTWLQNRFFCVPSLFNTVMVHRDVDSHFIEPHDFEFDADRVRRHIEERLVPDGDERANVISSELLTGNPLQGARDSAALAHRLKEAAPDARILITIRNQISVLVSIYQQYVRQCGTLTPKEFFNISRQPGYHYFDACHFSYHRLVGHYQNLFGPNRVKVILYEDFIRDQLGVCNEILGFAHPHAPHTLPELDTNPAASSAAMSSLPLLRIINRFRFGPMNVDPLLDLGRPALFTYRAIEKLGRRLQSDGGKSQKKKLQAYLRDCYGQVFADSNAVLQRQIGVELAPYGYIVNAEAPEPAQTSRQAPASLAHR